MRWLHGSSATAFCVGLVAAFSGATTHPPACDMGPWAELTGAHVERYPHMQPADLYKLLHQATYGAEHAVAYGDARAWLDRELAALDDGPPEPVIEPLGRDGRFMRVHLRPYLAAGGSEETLLSAFVDTADEAPDRRAFECALDAANELDAFPWPRARWDAYVAEQRTLDFPAVGHSPEFTSAYRPAYRLIARNRIPALSFTTYGRGVPRSSSSGERQ